MADILIIPTDSENSSFKMRTELEDKEFVLRFDWNGRLERWFISLMDGSENPLVMGMNLVTNWNLFGRFKGAAFPAGRMMLHDATGKGDECGRNGLGSTHFLLYQESE